MNNSGGLMIGIDVNIQRTDGRIHTAVVSAINRELESVTVEWFEKGEAKGKELEFEVIYHLNPLLAPFGWVKLKHEESVKPLPDNFFQSEPIPVTQPIQYVIPLDNKQNQLKTEVSNPKEKVKTEISNSKEKPKSILHNSLSERHKEATPIKENEKSVLNSSVKISEQQTVKKEVDFTDSSHRNSHGILNKGLSDSTPNLISHDNDSNNGALDNQRNTDNTSTQISDKMVTFDSETCLSETPLRQSINRRTVRSQRRSSCLQEIEKIQQRREERRAAINNKTLSGIPIPAITPGVNSTSTGNSTKSVNTKKPQQIVPEYDFSHPEFEFYQMIKEYQDTLEFKPLTFDDIVENHRICVCVRKRPLNKKEIQKQMMDVVTIPSKSCVLVHEPKVKVDLTKYVEHQTFRFDYAFDPAADNSLVYKFTAQPLVEFIFEGGMATCFAYGQTGSGKTHTMGGDFISKGNQDCTKGIYAMAATDVFKLKDGKYYDEDLYIDVSYFEIYSGKVFDLLNNKKKLRVLEDAKGQVQIVGLKSEAVLSLDAVLKLLQLGSHIRTSGTTSANQQSSRSHAVFQLAVKKGRFRKILGKFSLIDLAGNERGADTNSADRVTRIEGAEINKSLLALKECIRALGRRGAHLPFRGSKLTQVLRDSFIGERSRTCMIAMISPGSASCEHSLNTLRYADRVKELNPNVGAPISSGIPVPLSTLSVIPVPLHDAVLGDNNEKVDGCPTANTNLQLSSTGKSPTRPHIILSDTSNNETNNGRTDLFQIHETTNDSHTISNVMASFHEVIDHIEAMEEDISEQHKSIIELMPVWARKHKNLHKISNKPEYDVEEYASNLDELLANQIVALHELKDKVVLWREELKTEEEISFQLISNSSSPH